MLALLLQEPIASPLQGQCIDQVTIKIAENRDERSAAFRLVYHAYIRAGLIEPNPAGLRVTPYQLQPNCDIFIASLRD